VISLPEVFNVATYFVDRNVAEGRGEKIAIEAGTDRITYHELLERCNQVGNALRALDVRQEERVQILLEDVPEFLYCFFGAIKIGAVAVPTNPLLSSKDYEYLLNDTRARVVIAGETSLVQLQTIPRERLPYLKKIVVIGGSHDACLNFADITKVASPEMDAAATSKDDAAFWLYSSGSTGFPKGCVHLHHDMVVCSELYAQGILGMREQDRCYSVARLFFAYGLGNAGYFPLGAGATTILSPARPTPQEIYANIERYRPTLFFSVPANYAALLACPPPAGAEFDLSSIRHAISAGEALPAVLWQRFKDRFGIEILDALGSTEALHMVTSNRPGEVRAGSSGKVIPGYEARIIDENGVPVPTGEIGNLIVRGDSICAFYWNQHEKTKNTIEGEWIKTGDKYHQDEDGYLWYAGRSDDLFKVNGRWLSPAEVEGALLMHPAVKEAAVVGREDKDQLLKPAAFVVINPDFRADDKLAAELQDCVTKTLGGYKRPRWVEFLPELPKTATGKLQRFKLREWQRGLS
jgi:benzoate-CoA ligase